MIFECILAARQAAIIDRQRAQAKEHREMRLRIKQLEQQLAAMQQPDPKIEPPKS